MTSFIRFQDFCLIANLLHESIVIRTISGRSVYVNPVYTSVTGYSLDDLVGVSFLQLIHPEDRVAVLDAYQHLAQEGGQSRSISYRYRVKNDDYIHFDTTMTVLVGENDKPAWIVSASVMANNPNKPFEQARRLAAMEERQRLARDLHDAVSQTLFSASVVAESLPMLYETNPDEVVRGLRQLTALTKGALAEMRTLLVELRPSSLAEIDLGQLLTYLVNSFRTRIEGEIAYENHGCGKGIDVETKVSFYRIAQEALNNIVRHSRANFASVVLACTASELSLVIHDNGIGFDARLISGSHLGLRIMYERAESSGIELDIISVPSEGTQVRLSKVGVFHE